jgi:hypothetical protein
MAGALRRTAAVLLVAIGIAGCAANYRAAGPVGGYSEHRLNELTYRVTYQGNAQTSREDLRIYALYRCAELTVKHGFEYFLITEESEELERGRYLTDSPYVYPVYVLPPPRGTTTVTIQMADATDPEVSPDAIDARDYIARMKERVKGTSAQEIPPDSAER